MHEILKLDATAQAQLIKKKELTPLELVDLSIAATKKLNPTLNAVITPMFEQARDTAKKATLEAPFAGVPMMFKDGLAAYKGVPFSTGSALFKDNIAKHDSELVKRYKKAGFIVIGKTNMPEFGILPTTEPTAFGATKNPWDITKTPGGSSGGTASAVAARMVALAHGNDGGGSIRIPASCCGLFGLKPTRGRNPLAPMSSLVSGLVEEHVLTHSVRDSAAVLDITGQPDPYNFYHAPEQKDSYAALLEKPVRRLKIGYTLTQASGKPVHQDCVDATLKAVEMAQSFGHEVVEMPLTLPFSGKRLGEIFGVIWAVCAASPLAFYHKMTGMPPPKDLVEPLSYALYEQGQNVSGADYELARQGMHKVARSILEFFKDIDAWISPTLGMPPVELGSFPQSWENPLAPLEMAGKFSPITALFNISGQPAASVPVYWNADGLPIGVQIVTKFGDEGTLFQLAGQMEELVNWQGRLPEILTVT
ncbi:MAG: amidase [Bacteroidota bacterium]